LQQNQDPYFHDTWGKPGPGGKPWRDPKNVGQNFMKSMGWSTKDTLRSINNEMNSYQQNMPKCNKKQQLTCCDKCSCECVKKVESTILGSPPYKANQGQQNRADMEELVRISPKKSPHYALPQQCNRQERLEPLQTSSKVSTKHAQQNIKRPSKTNLISGGVELVPLLAKRRDDRPISLSTTDITKYKINKSR
jgi:hypothetical protein